MMKHQSETSTNMIVIDPHHLGVGREDDDASSTGNYQFGYDMVS